MKVALVHDYLNQYGGAERVLEALAEIYPQAPVYTLIYNREIAERILPERQIFASFLQKAPLIKKHHRYFPPLMPLAVEKFDLSEYDVVISDSAAFTKGVITKPETLHICYCHTPIRYAWDDCHKYIEEFNMPFWAKSFVPFFMNYLRIWDREASYRVDDFICNSEYVAQRIRKYYKREATVIYPPTDIEKFSPGGKTEDYFLMVGRLLVYKRFDMAIEAFNRLELPLKIIGTGPELKKLKKAANWNIEFLGDVDDKTLKKYYQGCQALILPQEEDFGIVAVEAMACARPVIAYRAGGAEESVKEGKTGIFFNEQKIGALVEAVKNFRPEKFNPEKIRLHAEQFGKNIFKDKIRKFVENRYYEYRNRH